MINIHTHRQTDMKKGNQTDRYNDQQKGDRQMTDWQMDIDGQWNG